MHKGTIVYIGGFELPDKNAAAHRVLSNAKIFKQLGFKTTLIGVTKDSNDSFNNTKNQYNQVGFDHYSINYPKTTINWLNYLINVNQTIKIVQEIKDVKYLICYNYPSIALLRLRSYCRKNNIKIISDVTEWYGQFDKFSFKNIFRWLDNNLRIRIINKKMDGLIVVSQYFKSYYKNNISLVIPTLIMNKTNINHCKNIGEKKRIIYAGTPFNTSESLKNKANAKDRLDIVINLLYKIHKKNIDFKFDIFGLTLEEYLTAIPEDKDILYRMRDKVHFNGKVNHDIVKNNLQRADFSMFIRDINKITMAGFPTKFAESIANGIPVITNNTSDLNDYMINGENGFFIDNNIHDEKNIELLEKILTLDNESINNMKICCLESRINNLTYWKEKSDKFFREFGV